MAALILLATGADWSERPIYGNRLTRSINRATGQTYAVDVVLRYANFNGQRLSYLDRAEYESHRAAGKRSYLIFQKGTADPAGGATGGRAFGAEAVAYARRLGYQPGDPIFFTADGWAASKGYTVETAMAFFTETTRVVREAGFLGGIYGFADVILTALHSGVGDVYWLCGDRAGLRKPDGSAQGIHLYQWNNGRVWIEAEPGVWVECDLVEQYEPIGDDEMSAETERKIGELYDWLLGKGTDSEHAALTGETPPTMGPGAGYKLILDTNLALRPFWELTGKSLGAGLAELVNDPRSPVTGDDAQRIITRLESTLPAALVNELRRTLNAGAPGSEVS